MNIDKLTSQFQQDLSSAQAIALKHNNSVIEPLHVLQAMLNNATGSVANLISQAKVNINNLNDQIEKQIELLAKVANTPNDISVSQNCVLN